MTDKKIKKPLSIAEMILMATNWNPKNFENFTIAEIRAIADLGYYYKTCPECVFIPSYPQLFKFDLIVGSKNYGKIKIRIDEYIELSAVEGDKTALDKLKEIGKKQAGKAFYYTIPSHKKNFISYPFKNAAELIVALFQGVETENTKELEKLRQFVAKVENPIDTELLYKKTGIVIDDY